MTAEQLRSRLGDLELSLQVARGRLAQIEETAAAEQSAVYQLEGRLLEAQELLAGLETVEATEEDTG